MSDVCPISFEQINEKVARLNGAQTTLLLIAFILTMNKFIVIFLCVDFLTRGFFKPKFSLIAIISKSILKFLKSKPQMTNAGPKIFAAKLGFLFSVITLVLSCLNQNLFSTIVAGMFGFFAFLEAAFGFCLACKVYPLLLKLKK